MIEHFIPTNIDTLSLALFLCGVKSNPGYCHRPKFRVLHFPLVVMDEPIVLDIQLNMGHMVSSICIPIKFYILN